MDGWMSRDTIRQNMLIHISYHRAIMLKNLSQRVFIKDCVMKYVNEKYIYFVQAWTHLITIIIQTVVLLNIKCFFFKKNKKQTPTVFMFRKRNEWLLAPEWFSINKSGTLEKKSGYPWYKPWQHDFPNFNLYWHHILIL